MTSEKVVETEQEQTLLDEWPRSSDGTEWDGTELLALLFSGKCPFGGALDVQALIHEIEDFLGNEIADIPTVTYGANHFGFYLRLQDGRPIVARVSRGDMNKPGFNAKAMEKQVMHDHFEIDAYDALSPLGLPFSCRPLYHRDPKKSDGNVLTPNQGRRLFLFEKAEGETYYYVPWRALNAQQKVWERSLGDANHPCPIPVEPTREFCIALLQAKIEVTLGRRNPSIHADKGYHLTPSTLESARKALLQLVPRILPKPTRHLRESALYRFVLDHGDFGMHNMTVAKDEEDQPRITAVYDWEGGSIVPAILSEPKMVTTVDLIINTAGEPFIKRWGDGDTPDKMAEYRSWAAEYYKALFSAVPEYKRIIKAGLDARRIWFTLHEYRGQNHDEYFGELGAWAVSRSEELDREEKQSWPGRLFCIFP